MAPRILTVDDNRELLALLAQLLEEAGYEVLKAERGKSALELSRHGAPELALLDVMLPDMSGFQLADSLQKRHPALPVVFMTGVFKGGRHAQEARLRYRALAYFEKPFEAQKLLELVARELPTQPRPSSNPSSPFEVEQAFDVEEETITDTMELTGRIRVTGGDDRAAELTGAKLTLQGVPFGARPSPAPPAPSSGERVQQGQLGNQLPALITAFYLAGETGELGVQKGKVKKSISFEKGQPIFAHSNLLGDRFGQFLVRVGKIRPDQLQDAVTVAGASHRRTGEVLIERGLLKENERLYFVGQQVKAIIYSLFAWEEGDYQLRFGAPPEREAIRLDVHPANLIARGVKKLYTPERLHRALPARTHLAPSGQPAYALSDLDLEKWEAMLLPRVDGTRSVSELVALSGRTENEVYAFLVAMVALTLLEPLPADPPPSS